jgi:hypothetical protein
LFGQTTKEAENHVDSSTVISLGRLALTLKCWYGNPLDEDVDVLASPTSFESSSSSLATVISCGWS